jgi:hypothetical protein
MSLLTVSGSLPPICSAHDDAIVVDASLLAIATCRSLINKDLKGSLSDWSILEHVEEL